MSASTVSQHVPGSLPGQADLRGLRRMTGLAGLATLLLVFIPGIAGSVQEPGFTGTSEQIGAFFGSIDTTMGSIGSFASTLGLIAFLCFALGLSTLLRGPSPRPRGGPTSPPDQRWSSSRWPWAAVGLAATLRAASLDPDVGRFAFDLGNASFANGWVASGSFAICSGAAIISTGVMPRSLG